MATCAGTQRGSKTELLLDYETGFLGPGQGAPKKLPFLTSSLSQTVAKEQSNVIDGTRNSVTPFNGQKEVGGDIVVPIDQRNIGWWFRLLMGLSEAPVDNGDGTFTHVWKVNNTDCQPSAILEMGYVDIPRYYRYTGCKIGNFSFTVNDGGELQATVTLVGVARTDEASPLSGSPGEFEVIPFNHNDATMNEGGVAFADATELSVDVDTQLSTDLFTIGNGGARGAIPDGKYALSGNLKALFDDMTLQDKAINSTETGIEVIFTGNQVIPHTLSVDIPEVQYSEKDPEVEGPQGVLQDLDYIGYYGDDAGDSSLIITLTNDIATYNS